MAPPKSASEPASAAADDDDDDDDADDAIDVAAEDATSGSNDVNIFADEMAFLFLSFSPFIARLGTTFNEGMKKS